MREFLLTDRSKEKKKKPRGIKHPETMAISQVRNRSELLHCEDRTVIDALHSLLSTSNRRSTDLAVNGKELRRNRTLSVPHQSNVGSM